MSADSISWIFPAQDILLGTLETLSRVRERTRDLRAEIILVDRPSAIASCREVPGDVLIVRTERRLSLPRLLHAGLSASRGEIIIWCPRADLIPVGNLAESIDFVSRVNALVLAARGKPVNADESAEQYRAIPILKRVGLRLCREWFVSRRAPALSISRRLSTWGDLPVFTAGILGIMRLPMFIDHGLAPLERVQSPIEMTMSNAVPEAPVMRTAVRHRQRSEPLASVIITAHNEGAEVLRTIQSVEANTRSAVEFIVVDDGSTDGCCENLTRERLRVIRHDRRIGVAFSRNAGALVARGEVLVFLDGHQRVSAGCIERSATVALSKRAIVCPDVRTLHNRSAIGHGAFFRLGGDGSPFTATWNTRRSGHRLTKITSLRAPGYFVPRKLFEELRWISQLRGWGGSEAAMALKAFFLGIDILHLCGPVARHLFRRKFQYTVDDEEVTRNHALIARVCFDDWTWFEHWLPRVFDGRLSDQTIRDLEAPDVVREREEFMKLKRRPDREFWLGLLRRDEPENLRSAPAAFASRSPIPRRNVVPWGWK
jgi:glycosyltransferase involved in cell wall biosynthesis